MKKGICSKCHKLIQVDENVNPYTCPSCGESISSIDSIKEFNREANLYKRKAELAFLGSTNYEKAYENYSKLLTLAENVLSVLSGTTLAKLYCSNLHNIYIKEATDILLKGSDKVEINDDNVKILSEFLKKFRLDSLSIINALDKYKSESNYALNLYHKALNEFIYYLNAYLDIYNSLDKLNVYFVEGKDAIEDDIKLANTKLKENIKVKNISEVKHDFYNEKKKVVIDIFPNKKKMYKFRMGLYILMGIGFILSIVGLIMLATNSDKVVPSILACIGLVFFVGGYFISHKIKSKTYGTDY